jgi:hypothetical protein
LTNGGGSETVTFTNAFELQLWAGSPVDDTAWLDGNAGGSYPGSLTGFLASNSDGNAVGGYKLVCGTLATITDADTLSAGGDGSKIIAVIIGDTPDAADAVTASVSAGVVTFTVVGGPTATSTTMWAIVA